MTEIPVNNESGLPHAVPRDFRECLDALEKAGLVIRVTRSINKDTELHPLVRWQFRGLPESQRRAFLFENVRDSRGRSYDMPVVVGALAGSEDIYTLGMGCTNSEEAFERWENALANPVAPRLVATGPAQEVVHAGEGLLEHGGLDEFPVPVSSPGMDNAPYLNSAIWFVKDPETGVQNAGVYRGQLKGPLRTGVFCDTSNDAAGIWDKAHKLGVPLPAAAVIGAPPAVYYSAIQMAPQGVDEMSIAGGLLDEPLDMLQCKTVDLVVPAAAEIVLEGLIRTDIVEPEGAFGEAHGYVDPRALSFVFEITAITHRFKPVFLSIISQVTPSESSKTKQSGYQIGLLRFLRDSCGLRGVQQVALIEDLLNRQVGIVVMRKRDRFEPRSALHAMLSRRQTPKILIAVDEDIDPHDLAMVFWAMAFRCQPHRDIDIVHPRQTQFGPLRYVQGDGYDRDDSCLLIDATRKADFPPVALPTREYMEAAKGIWEDLGLPALQPRPPWFGYSLGMWPEENQQEAAAAVRGDYYETGDKLARAQVQVPRDQSLADLDRHLPTVPGGAPASEP